MGWMNMKDVMRLFDCSRGTVYNMIRAGKLVRAKRRVSGVWFRETDVMDLYNADDSFRLMVVRRRKKTG